MLCNKHIPMIKIIFKHEEQQESHEQVQVKVDPVNKSGVFCSWQVQNSTMNYIGVAWPGFGGRVYRGDFCQKLLKASPMSRRDNDSQLQDRPTIVQG